MGKAYLYGNGGGGSSLNFKVVGGTTQPTNPSENTIWINTETEITGWAFAADNPFFEEYEQNIYDGTHTSDKYINSSGALSSANDRSATGYMELPENCVSVRVQHNTVYHASVQHAWYDANQSFISAFNPNGASFSVVPPSNAKYVRCSIQDNDLSAWSCIAVTQGSSAGEGAVWIRTGRLSNAPLAADKKGKLVLSPQNCVQYVSGMWQSRVCRVYLSGEWRGLDYYYWENGTAHAPIINTGADVTNMTIPSFEGSTVKSSLFQQDLTDIDTLVFDVTYSNPNAYAGIKIGAWSIKPTDSSTVDCIAGVSKTGSVSKTHELIAVNVSALSGVFYFGIAGRNGSSGSWRCTCHTLYARFGG